MEHEAVRRALRGVDDARALEERPRGGRVSERVVIPRVSARENRARARAYACAVLRVRLVDARQLVRSHVERVDCDAGRDDGEHRVDGGARASSASREVRQRRETLQPQRTGGEHGGDRARDRAPIKKQWPQPLAVATGADVRQRGHPQQRARGTQLALPQ